eukprot:SM000069S20746  [mRNA]  locus=s69:659884:663464:- [translate_table: standard]
MAPATLSVHAIAPALQQLAKPAISTWLAYSRSLDSAVAFFGYDLVITGHSLGAGTAALLTIMLRLPQLSEKGSIASPISQHLGGPLTSISYRAIFCHRCVDHRLALASSFVRTVVVADNVVARASASVLEDLRSEIIKTNWSQVLKDGSKRSHIFMMAHATDWHLSRMELALGYDKGHLDKKMAQLGGMVRGRLQDESSTRIEEVKAATYIASGTSDIITAPPLVMPGLLYHVVLQTLQAGEVPPLSQDLTAEAGSSEAEQGINGGAGSLREDEPEAVLQHKSSRSWWAWGGSSSKNSSSKEDDEAVDATTKPGGSCKRAEEDLLAETVVNGAHREGESVDAATIVKPGTLAKQPDKGEKSSWWASLTRKKVEDEPGVAGAGVVIIETDGNGKELTEEVHEGHGAGFVARKYPDGTICDTLDPAKIDLRFQVASCSNGRCTHVISNKPNSTVCGSTEVDTPCESNECCARCDGVGRGDDNISDNQPCTKIQVDASPIIVPAMEPLALSIFLEHTYTPAQGCYGGAIGILIR